MSEMRLILRDRWSGGMLAALTALLVLVQVLASAWSCAAALRVGPDPLMVICHGSGTALVETPSSGDPGSDAEHGCPGGILCGVGVTFAVAPPTLDLGAAYALRGGIDVRYADGPMAGRIQRGLVGPPFPTGPPAVSA